MAILYLLAKLFLAKCPGGLLTEIISQVKTMCSLSCSVATPLAPNSMLGVLLFEDHVFGISVEIISQVQIHDVPNIELGGQGGGAHMLVSGAALRWAMSSFGLSIFTCEIISVHCLKKTHFLVCCRRGVR